MTQNSLNSKSSKIQENSQRTVQQAQFFNISLDLLCILDKNGQIQQINPAFKTVFGKLADTMPGQNLIHFVDEADRLDIASILDNLEAFPATVSFECRFRGLDMSIQWFLWTIYPQSDGMFHAIGRDITPYKQMENREHERNIFAEALLDTVLAINASLSLEEVLERILANIGKVVAYDFVNILLIDGHMAEVVGSQSRLPYRIDVQLYDRPKFSIYNNIHLNFIYTEKDCIIVPDIVHPPKWMMSSTTKYESGSFLGAPIVVEDKVIGFLGIFNSQKGFFTPLHARHLTTFANQVGITIVNARLYEQSQTAATLRERQRVARDLHDSVNQELFAARTYADLLIKAIETKPETAKRFAGDISKLIRGAVEQMRMILIELQPDTLTGTDLILLIQQLVKTFNYRTAVPVNFQASGQVILAPLEQIAVYRIMQEALHNIEKHASAENVSITIQYDNTHFKFEISDDGVGFEQQHLSEIQFGIRGMQERSSNIQADLKIISAPGQGTSIIFSKDY